MSKIASCTTVTALRLLVLRIFLTSILIQKGASYYIAVVTLMTIFVFITQETCFSQAPPIEWQKTFGGSSSDEAEKIIQTSDDGYIMAGWTFSNDGDGGGNHGPMEIAGS